MTHTLKTWPEYFNAIKSGKKNFELRKDDRIFAEGDIVVLQEYNPEDGKYTGDEHHTRISYILRDAYPFGLRKGYVILGLKEHNGRPKSIPMPHLTY